MRYDASPVNSLSVGVMPISNVNGKNTLGINLSYHFGADNPNSNENMTLNLLGYAKRVNQWSAADISGAALTVAGLTAAIAAGVVLSSNSNNKAGQSDAFIWQNIKQSGPNGTYPEHYRQLMLVEAVNSKNAEIIRQVNEENARIAAANANSQAPQTPVTIAPDAVVQPTTMQITTPTITEQQNSVPTVPVATTAPTTASTLPTTTDGYSLAAEAAINAAVAKTPPATGESKSGGGYIIK